MVFLALVGILACGDQPGPVEPTSASVTGRVVDSSTLLPIAAAQVSVEGVVVVASTGAPVSGAQVSIAGSSAPTAGDGHFELDGLVSGPTVVRVIAPGFEDHESEVVLYPGPGTANIALRSIVDPGVTFDLTAQVHRFDPAWGDQTGSRYTAVLTLPVDYRTIGAFGGTLSDWRFVGVDGTRPVGTWRITGDVVSGGRIVIEADRLGWTMSARVGGSGNLVGSWGCCGHASGSFTATLRPPS